MFAADRSITMFCIKTFLFIFFISHFCFAQTHGKLYSSEEADLNFGPVLESVTIGTDQIKRILELSSENLMFNIIESRLVILDANRNILYADGITEVASETVFHMYSSSLVNELLQRGLNAGTFIEKRANVLSITNGDVTLEYGTPCPPYCK
jgi:hypothetical protein